MFPVKRLSIQGKMTTFVDRKREANLSSQNKQK